MVVVTANTGGGSTKNFHDSIRQMFTGNIGATSTTSLASTFSASSESLDEIVRMNRQYNVTALKMMTEQTKLLRQLVAKTDGGSSGLSWLDLLLLKGGKGKGLGGMVKSLPKLVIAAIMDSLGISTAFAAAGGAARGLMGGIKTITTKGVESITSVLSKSAGFAFSRVAAAGRTIFSPMAGLTNILSSSGVTKMLTGAGTAIKFLPKLLGKLFWPITALMSLADGFSGWSNAENILGKNSVTFGDRLSAAVGSAINGVLFGVPDWLVQQFGGDNLSSFLASSKDAISSGFTSLFGGVSTLIGSSIDYLKASLPSARALLGTTAAYVSDKVHDSFSYVTSTVWESITSLGDLISEGFKEFFTNMWSGIKSWFSTGQVPAGAPSGAGRAGSRPWGGGGGSSPAGSTTSSAGSGGNEIINPRPTNTPKLPSGEDAGSPYTGPKPRQGSNATGGSGGTLGALVAGAESGSAKYNAYNRGTANGRILGPIGPVDLENMSIDELMRRQALPKSDPDRIFAAGKYQAIPGTLKEAVTKLGISGDTKFSPDTQERIFRDYLVGDKRPAVRNYITGKTDNPNAAVEALANEFASFGGVDGRGKYGDGNKVSVSPQKSSAVLQAMRTTYQNKIASGMSPEDAYASAFGATPQSSSPLTETASIPDVKASGNMQPSDLGKPQPSSLGAPGYHSVGNFKSRNEELVRSDLRDIISKAALDPEIAEKYRVEAFSGARFNNADSRHFAGDGQSDAMDVTLYDKVTGQKYENYQNGADFSHYEKLAQKARLIQQRDYPEMNDQFRWGGYFAGNKEGRPGGRYGALDSMHFDMTPGGAMAGGSWEKGLTAQQRRYFPDAQSTGIASTQLTPTSTDYAVQNKERRSIMESTPDSQRMEKKAFSTPEYDPLMQNMNLDTRPTLLDQGPINENTLPPKTSGSKEPVETSFKVNDLPSTDEWSMLIMNGSVMT